MIKKLKKKKTKSQLFIITKKYIYIRFKKKTIGEAKSGAISSFGQAVNYNNCNLSIIIRVPYPSQTI